MSSAIELLWKQALKTFAGRRSLGYELCNKNFDKLRCLMNDIKAEDVRIDKNILRFVESQSAPMCVMDVYEDDDITITIFLLKHGVTMPMHDHPGMHGLLKVLSGAVRINSYTAEVLDGWSLQPGKDILALKHPPITVCHSDPTCVLTPVDQNFHEISCVEGPAVFLDILSPPYFSDGMRPCTYFRETLYQEADEESDETAVKVQLVAMTKPPGFYSGWIKYSGPPLSRMGLPSPLSAQYKG